MVSLSWSWYCKYVCQHTSVHSDSANWPGDEAGWVPYIGFSENPLHIYVIFLSFFSNFTLSNRASKILIKKESSACKFHSSSEKTRTVVKEMLFRNTFSIFFCLRENWIVWKFGHVSTSAVFCKSVLTTGLPQPLPWCLLVSNMVVAGEKRVFSPVTAILLVFSVTPFKIDQNKKQNPLIDKVQNLGNERR